VNFQKDIHEIKTNLEGVTRTIHRLPSTKPGPQPVIVRLFNSDVKRRLKKINQSETKIACGGHVC
jgi:hypothetical protein